MTFILFILDLLAHPLTDDIILLDIEMKTITVKVKAFASISEILAKRDFDFSVPQGSTIEDLKSLIFNGVKNKNDTRKSLLYSVNYTYATLDTILMDGDEVAIMPMVSGG